jgi:hypothetical protein
MSGVKLPERIGGNICSLGIAGKLVFMIFFRNPLQNRNS